MDAGIKYVDVTSSNVHSVGYRESDQTLFVRFKDKATGAVKSRYAFFNVPQDLWEAMPTAHTGSQWFNPLIKDQFEYTEF